MLIMCYFVLVPHVGCGKTHCAVLLTYLFWGLCSDFAEMLWVTLSHSHPSAKFCPYLSSFPEDYAKMLLNRVITKCLVENKIDITISS